MTHFEMRNTGNWQKKMKKHEKILEQFINKYAQIPGVKGIFWGGSSSEQMSNEFSDIDIFIVTDDKIGREHGILRIDGMDVEYFINPINRIYKQMNEEIEKIHDYWVIKIYAFSKIVYDFENEARKLQTKAYKMFLTPFTEINKSRDLENYYQAYDAYQKCKGMAHMRLQWKIMYYECIKALINAHCYHNKLPLMPWSKAQRLLTDIKYRKAYHLEELPEAEFCTLLVDCFEDDEDVIMKKRLQKLFEYCMDNSGFNISEGIILKKERDSVYV